MAVMLAALLGVVIGVSLGALGGGGSILTVPALVFVLGEAPAAATTGSLVIVGVTSLIGALGHARSRHVRWSAGAVFGIVGVAGSFAGTAVNHGLDPNVLLLLFAVLMVVAAFAMIRRSAAPAPETGDDERNGVAGSGSGVFGSAARAATHRRTGAGVKLVVAGSIVGFLTGLLGVGGGFIVVPALVMALGFDMPVAVGTSLLVIAINAAAALAARVGSESFDWAVIVPFTLAAVVGSLGGKIVADRLPERVLTRAFAGLLLAIAAYTGIRSAAALL